MQKDHVWKGTSIHRILTLKATNLIKELILLYTLLIENAILMCAERRILIQIFVFKLLKLCVCVDLKKILKIKTFDCRIQHNTPLTPTSHPSPAHTNTHTPTHTHTHTHQMYMMHMVLSFWASYLVLCFIH